MTKYHTLKDGQNFGPYSPAEIRSRLDSGELSPDDFVWTDGMPDWLPIRTILALFTASSPTLPTQVTVLPPASSHAEPVKQPSRVWNFLNKEKQPAVHVQVTNKGCGSGCGTLLVVLLGIGFVMNLLEDKKSVNSPTGASSKTKAEKFFLEGNRAILANRDAHKSKGTSIQRDDEVKAVEKQYLGQTLEFDGKISDVKSDTKIVVEVEPSEFANVIFDRSSEELHNLQKGAYIKFTATISSFGTGILFHHDFIHAKIVNSESKTTG